MRVRAWTYSITLLTALTAALAPAMADWGSTRWGMSVAETGTATQGKATPTTGTAQDAMTDPSLIIGAAGPAEIGRFQFQAKYYYRGGALAHIKYELRPQRACGTLSDELYAQYGAPLRERKSGQFQSVVWNNAASNVQLTMMQIGPNYCAVDIQPAT